MSSMYSVFNLSNLIKKGKLFKSLNNLFSFSTNNIIFIQQLYTSIQQCTYDTCFEIMATDTKHSEDIY